MSENLLFYSKDLRVNKFDKQIVYASENVESTTYAKALADCNLYKTKEMSQEIEDIYFQVPETYFVTILENVSEDCYKVQYDRFVGYVDSSTVIVATFVPIVKTLSNVTFDIKNTSGTQIWQYPTTKADICTTISAGTKGISYIASAYGSVPSGGENNVWYYVYYTPDSNSTNVYEGYIYSENTTNLSDIVANTETNPAVISDEQESEKLLFISSTLKTVVISIIAIPIILFFAIILYKLIKKIKKNTKYNKNNIIAENEKDDEYVRTQNLNRLEKYKNMKLVKNKKLTPNFNDFDDDDLL